MNALAGLVSYLPAAGGGLWAMAGGNSRLASGMLRAAAASVHLGTRVISVRCGDQAHSSFMLTARTGPAEQREFGPYDSVVLASPLELSRIRVECGSSDQQCAADEAGEAQRTYQRTVTTFIVGGELQPAAFGVRMLPAHTVFVTEHAATDFSSIAGRLVGPSRERVYKVFSPEPLPPHRITQLFGAGARVLGNRTWDAYPRFAPPERFAPFELAPGLCYASALENAASAMEVAAIAGRNCALLLWGGPGGQEGQAAYS
jgi:prenylcysteine oxidase/farnesylcysteine lyase